MSAMTKRRLGVDRHDAEVRHERRERVVGDLGARARDGADERALADVGEAEQAHVGHHLELEAQVQLLPGLAGLGAARRAVVGRREVDVAAPAAAAARDDDPLADVVDVEEELVRRGVEHLRSDGHADDEVAAALAVLVLAAPVLATLGLEPARQRHVEERRLAGVAHEDDVAALAAVASRRAAVRDVLLAPERDAAVPAVAGDDLHLARVDELHGWERSL